MSAKKDANNCITSTTDSDNTGVQQRTLYGLKVICFDREAAKDTKLDNGKFLFVNQLTLDMKG